MTLVSVLLEECPRSRRSDLAAAIALLDLPTDLVLDAPILRSRFRRRALTCHPDRALIRDQSDNVAGIPRPPQDRNSLCPHGAARDDAFSPIHHHTASSSSIGNSSAPPPEASHASFIQLTAAVAVVEAQLTLRSAVVSQAETYLKSFESRWEERAAALRTQAKDAWERNRRRASATASPIPSRSCTPTRPVRVAMMPATAAAVADGVDPRGAPTVVSRPLAPAVAYAPLSPSGLLRLRGGIEVGQRRVAVECAANVSTVPINLVLLNPTVTKRRDDGGVGALLPDQPAVVAMTATAPLMSTEEDATMQKGENAVEAPLRAKVNSWASSPPSLSFSSEAAATTTTTPATQEVSSAAMPYSLRRTSSPFRPSSPFARSLRRPSTAAANDGANANIGCGTASASLLRKAAGSPTRCRIIMATTTSTSSPSRRAMSGGLADTVAYSPWQKLSTANPPPQSDELWWLRRDNRKSGHGTTTTHSGFRQNVKVVARYDLPQE